MSDHDLPTKPKRSTKAHISQRVAEVLELLLGGHTRYHILQYAAENWDVCVRTADEYIALANKQLEEVNKVSIEKNIALISKGLWKQYRDADRVSDKIAALKELARIKGIGTTNVSLSVEDNRELAALSEDELSQFYGSSED